MRFQNPETMKVRMMESNIRLEATPRPTVAADGSIGVEQRLNLSLTIDHQVIDGADGARFLRDLVAAIDNIDVTVLA